MAVAVATPRHPALHRRRFARTDPDGPAANHAGFHLLHLHRPRPRDQSTGSDVQILGKGSCIKARPGDET